jgi:hypothetical protein
MPELVAKIPPIRAGGSGNRPDLRSPSGIPEGRGTPHFRPDVNGFDIHFIHQRAAGDQPLPTRPGRPDIAQRAAGVIAKLPGT